MRSAAAAIARLSSGYGQSPGSRSSATKIRSAGRKVDRRATRPSLSWACSCADAKSTLRQSARRSVRSPPSGSSAVVILSGTALPLRAAHARSAGSVSSELPSSKTCASTLAKAPSSARAVTLPSSASTPRFPMPLAQPPTSRWRAPGGVTRLRRCCESPLSCAHAGPRTPCAAFVHPREVQTPCCTTRRALALREGCSSACSRHSVLPCAR